MRDCYVYILASKRYGTLYTGVTSDLAERVNQHKHDLLEGFTKRHGIHDLVWFEMHAEIQDAIAREKQIKGWNRAWKIRLIEKGNPTGMISTRGFSPKWGGAYLSRSNSEF